MNIIPFLLLPFGEYLLVSGSALWVLLVCFKQKLSATVLGIWLAPISLWLCLVLLKDSGTLMNLIVEPLILAVGFALSAAVWMALTTGPSRKTRAAGVVAAALVMALAVCIRLFTPVLPE